jgi:hypothetical protein
MQRETGTQTKGCPTCGAALAVVELGDGSLSTVLCSNCYGGSVETAAVVEEPREFGIEDDDEDDDDALDD